MDGREPVEQGGSSTSTETPQPTGSGSTTIISLLDPWSVAGDWTQRPRKLSDYLAASKRGGEGRLAVQFPVLVSKAGRPNEDVLRSAVVYPIATMVPRAAPATRLLPDEVVRLHAGRTDECDILIDDITASRRHSAIVRRAGERWSVVDEGSLNGTFVDGEQVLQGQPVEVPGDQATIGFGPRERFFFFGEAAFGAYLRTLQASYTVASPGAKRNGRAFRPPTADPIRTTAPLSDRPSIAEELMAAGILARIRWAKVECDVYVVALDGAVVEELAKLEELERFVRKNARRIVAIEAWRGGHLVRVLHRRPGTEE